MKNVWVLVAWLGVVGVGQAQEVPVPVTPGLIQSQIAKVKDFGTFIWSDVKNNTGFKLDSTIPYSAVDWKRGVWSAGTATPFFHVGSYLYTGVSASWITSSRTPSQASLVEGVRLNGVTRPAACYILDKLTFNNLDKLPLLEKVANATSVGILGGHDFNYTEKEKVVINTVSMFFGFEIAFGAPKATASSSKKNVMFLR